MEYRGVRYAIRIGIARQQWRVAIHAVANQLPKERTVIGTREDAEITARSMINAWLKQRSALKKLKRKRAAPTKISRLAQGERYANG